MGQPWDNRGTTETSFDENFARALRKSKNQMMYEKLDSQDSSFLHVSTDSCPSCCAFFNLFQSFPWLCCFANVFQRLQVQVSTPGAMAIDMASAFSHGPADFVAAVQALRSAVRRIASTPGGAALGSQTPQVTQVIRSGVGIGVNMCQYLKLGSPTKIATSHFSKPGPKTHTPRQRLSQRLPCFHSPIRLVHREYRDTHLLTISGEHEQN